MPALMLLVLLGGCAFDAQRVDPKSPQPSQPMEEGLWEISRKFEEAIAISGRRVDDAALESYLQEVGCRVAGPHCPSIRVYPIIAPDFNASMSPNGFMQVWTGLMLRAENEAQLATVLGHEVTHYVERHSLERLEATRRTANLLLAAQFGLFAGGYSAISSGPVRVSLGDVTSLVAGGYLAAYSREHEDESDRGGFDQLVKSGYAAAEASAVWRHLIAEQETCDLQRPAALFASHPPTKERMETLEKLANGAPAGETGKERFLAATLPHRAGWIRQELAQRRLCRVKVVLERLLEQGANPGELHYFLGEVYRLRNEEGDDEKALAAYSQATVAAGAPPEAHRELGLALRRAGRRAEASAALQAYLDRAGTPQDAVMIQAYLEELK